MGTQTSTNGEVFQTRESDGAKVQVITPKYPTFVLEDTPQCFGDGPLYDRVTAFGADEIEVISRKDMSSEHPAHRHNVINPRQAHGGKGDFTIAVLW